MFYLFAAYSWLLVVLGSVGRTKRVEGLSDSASFALFLTDLSWSLCLHALCMLVVYAIVREVTNE